MIPFSADVAILQKERNYKKIRFLNSILYYACYWLWSMAVVHGRVPIITLFRAVTIVDVRVICALNRGDGIWAVELFKFLAHFEP